MKNIIRDEFDELRNDNPFWSLNHTVYRFLLECIVTMKIEPGARIYELNIAKMLGVSRSPVNFALQQLIKEGMVVRESGQAYYVAPLEYKGFIEICEARQVIEGDATKYAALRITNTQLKKLENLVKDPAGAFREQSIQQFEAYDNDFHTLIVSAAHNRYICMMYDSIQTWILRYRYFQFYHWGENVILESTKNKWAHSVIYKAISNGYSEIAKTEMINHIGELKKLTSINP